MLFPKTTGESPVLGHDCSQNQIETPGGNVSELHLSSYLEVTMFNTMVYAKKLESVGLPREQAER